MRRLGKQSHTHGNAWPWRRLGVEVWEFNFRGRTARVEARDDQTNDLDRLYVARVDFPSIWDDYDREAPLVEDAFWRE
jgi:hypothetical protein